MQATQKNRIKIGIVIGLSVVLLTVVLLRFLKSETADGVIVPMAYEAKMARLPIPKIPSFHLRNFQERKERQTQTNLLTLTRDIFQPSNPPPMKSKKSLHGKTSDTGKPAPTFQLKGTITGGTEPLAIIDDRFVRCGDVIQDYTVARIDEDKIVLKSGEKEINVEVFKVIEPLKR